MLYPSIPNTISKYTCFFIFLLFHSTFLNGQLSEGGIPASFQYKSSLLSSERIEKTILKEVDVEKLRAEDKNETGGIARAGIGLPVEIDILKDGTWEQLPSGEYICRYKIHAKDAPALSLFYSKFKIAPGDKLFYYNDTGDKVYGAFTEKNNKASGKFATAMLYSDVIILEFFSPRSKDVCLSQIVIESVVNYYIYSRHNGNRDNDNQQGCNSDAATCHIGINCSGFPQDWQNEKLGVAMMAIPVQMGNDILNVGFCSGSLINNTSTDGAPLFLTAMHCLCAVGSGDAINFPVQDQYVFYWDFEAPLSNCGQNCPSQNFNSTCGAYILANDKPSDFALLYLSEENGIYPRDLNGWDKNEISATNPIIGVGIHHPLGNAKKISRSLNVQMNAIEPFTWPNTCMSGIFPSNSNQRVTWNQGTTEIASSGSPLFSENSKNIIGQLRGGSASCDNTSGLDFYGALSYSWLNNYNISIRRRLDHWLDPINLGSTTHPSQSFGVPNSPTGNPQILSTTVSCQGNNTFHLLMNAAAPFGVYEIIVGNVRDTVVIHSNPYVYINYFPGSPSVSSPVVIILKPLYTDPITTMQDQESVICTSNCTLNVTSDSAPVCQNTTSFMVDFTFSVSGTGGTYHITDGNTSYPDAMPDQSYLFGPYLNGANVNITVSGNNGCIRTFTYTVNCACTNVLNLTTEDSPLSGTYQAADTINITGNVVVSPSGNVVLKAPLVKLSEQFNLGNLSNITISPDGCNIIPIGTISNIYCSNATITGTLTSGTPANGITAAVPYTGGNGGTHNGQTVSSTGVTGLTATLESGTFSSVSGSLTYTITGIPGSAGSASFALNIGGQSCTLTVTVAASGPPYPAGYVHCNPSNPTVVVEVLNPITNKTWMDRNLGANRAAISSTDAQSYGSLFQWGRGADGHQCVNRYAGDGVTTSGTTTTLSSTNQPGHGNFILAPNSPYDWRSPQNTNLWFGVNGVNNPCPSGFRLPSETEWNAEVASWGSSNSTGAFSSPLKLPVAGSRHHGVDALINAGVSGTYWSSWATGSTSRALEISSSTANVASRRRAYGGSVRCIKN